MGLDMYLHQDQHFARIESLAEAYDDYRRQFDTAEKIIEAMGNSPEGVGGVDVRTTVLKWRKENAIHNWFVKNVQDGEDDCGEYFVTDEQLLELRDTCDKVLKASKLVSGKVYAGTVWSDEFPNGHTTFDDGKVVENADVARKLLPTADGFFFGQTDYDEWYIRGLEYTRDGISRILKNKPDDAWLYYSSSW